ncbi:DNA-binding transcriptional regulator, FadR family [Mucilaginibacter gossypiicola]|uniref:DNA-binding transcriptional regulator, FadR family n=1 Tax=Mucilaginibacter gossypiicola TaxID=551995 RepID=A0A1H8UBM9_9SPHI|nr:FCD domain-containing protein [Mucilaginibacter gossypiicola]SEP00264.1 DNA-binding transcriptional regulator, FadR family [Mucilaginibacter gossypiicola]
MAIKEKLGDKVVGLLKQDIAANKFKAGEKIPSEPELMRLYNVGRSTVREAVKTLVTAGILTVKQGYGTIVNSDLPDRTIDQRLRQADFEDINAVRSLLECEIVKLAAGLHTSEQLSDIEHFLKLRREAIEQENRQACADADIAFHMAIAGAAQNKVLADLYQSFAHIIRDFFNKREKQGVSHFALSHHLHEQLFNAIKARKGKQAQQIIQHILNHNY